ncbi:MULTISPECIES: hypothetical protein [unclassified Saccharicrinis]|uniref:hypothetical protein n=1 Tax=unclassified Saccharicrinis TaxID=2646859 RepID=UPI003D342F69
MKKTNLLLTLFLAIANVFAQKQPNVIVVLADDLARGYNPGPTPSGNMNLVVATACIKMKMNL